MSTPTKQSIGAMYPKEAFSFFQCKVKLGKNTVMNKTELIENQCLLDFSSKDKVKLIDIQLSSISNCHYYTVLVFLL